MKKIRLLALLLCFAVSTGCFFACGNTDDNGSSSSGDATKEMPATELDLFENKSLAPAEGLSGLIEWKSSDETVATVKDGVVSAEGKEGAVTVTATAGGFTVTYPVTVTDSGDRPVLSVTPVSVYKGKTVDVKESLSLSYKDKNVESGVTFTYNALSEIIAVEEDGTLRGVTAGVTRMQVRATYKGFTTAAKAVTVTVEESDTVKPASDKISLSTIAGDVDPTSAEIEAEVFVNAEKVENATITAEIESGADYIELDGLTIRAKAVGKAEVRLVYDNHGTDVTGSIAVTVHDDTVEYKAGAMLKGVEDSTFTKVFDGEFKDCYEYKLGKKGNYWNNAVTESSSLESILANGYKTFSYDIYFADTAAFVVYIPSSFQSSSGAYCMYDLSASGNRFGPEAMGKYTGDDDLLHIYGEDGKRLADGTELVTGKWYTVVYDISTYTDGWSLMGFSINVDQANNQKAYLKNFAFHTTANLLPDGTYDERHPIGEVDDPEVTDEKDDFLNNISVGSKAVTVKKVVNGSFKDAYKIRSQTTSSSGTITFNDIHNKTFEPQSFFGNGYHYIKFDLYIASGNGLGICNWIKGVNGGADVKLEMNITSSVTEHETVRIYNANGNLSPLGNGSWYTILVYVPYDDANLPEWDLFYIGLNGSKYAPAVGYIRNMSYLKEDPEIVGDNSEIATKLTTSASLKKQTEEVDNVSDAYLYENKTENFYTGRLEFQAQTYVGKVVSLKVRFNGAARPYFSINYVNSYDKNGWTFDKQIHYFDLEGNYVKKTEDNAWYILIVDLSGSADWINYITLDKDGSMYIADLRLLDECPYEIPEEDTSNIAKMIQTAGTLAKQNEAIDGVEGAYLYTSTGWYADRLDFGMGNAAVTGKAITLKIRLNNEQAIYYAVNYVNSYDKNGWTFDGNIRYYTADRKLVKTLSKDVWYTVLIDLTGSTDWLWYITLDGGNMYIADLQVSDENPFADVAEDNGNIEKYLSVGEESTLESAGTYEGVANAYKYTNNGNWWTGRLGVSSGDFKGKFVSLKIRNEYNGVFTLGGNTNFVTAVSHAKIYDMQGNAVTSMAQGVWYEIVIDYTTVAPESFWSSYLEGSAGIVTYLADLKILDSDPHNA